MIDNDVASGSVGTLAVITSVHGSRDGDVLILDQKALTGMEFWAKHWPGKLCWMLHFEDAPPSYSVRCDAAGLPFEVIEIGPDRSDVVARLPADAIVQASADLWQDLGLAAQMPGRIVYVLEYTLRTRLDILRVSSRSMLRKLRVLVWELQTERKRKRAIREAASLHCNGLPAFNQYGPLSPAAFQYFDTRLTRAMQIGSSELTAKQEQVRRGEPLRLAFSGRLDRMKGAHWLLPLMQRLKARDVAFTFEVFGDGECAPSLRDASVGEFALQLITHGAVSFADVLVPAMKERIDLFICLHPQGDPACTYMETLGCGVPIVGFGNEAWAAMVKGNDFGVAVPIGDIEALARMIEALDKDRDALGAMVEVAATYSETRSFEDVFLGRLEHLKQLSVSLTSR